MALRFVPPRVQRAHAHSYGIFHKSVLRHVRRLFNEATVKLFNPRERADGVEFLEALSKLLLLLLP